MPFVSEENWRGLLMDDMGDKHDLSLFCTFPYSVFIDILNKMNKKRDSKSQIIYVIDQLNCEDNHIMSQSYNNWDDRLGVVLYSSSKRTFLFSSFHMELSNYYRFQHNSEIRSLKEKKKVLESFLNNPNETSLLEAIEKLEHYSDLKEDFEEKYFSLNKDFELFSFKHNLDDRYSVIVLWNQSESESQIKKIEEEKKKLQLDSKSHDFTNLVNLFKDEIYIKLLEKYSTELDKEIDNKKWIEKEMNLQDKLIEDANYIAFI